jgi:riboflavin biosynthesis pyrimidine reductase
VRVVIDAARRLGPNHRVFRGGPATLLLCAEDAPATDAGGAEVLRLPRGGHGLDAARIIAALAARGLRRIYVEGGGITVSRFLAARCLDRLHVTIAPLLLGSGIPAFSLPGVACPQDGMRLDWTVHRLGEDILFDIPLERRV